VLTERPAPREPYAREAFGEAIARCRRGHESDPGLLDLASALFGVQAALSGDLESDTCGDLGAADWLQRAAPAVAAAVAASSPSAPAGLRGIAASLRQVGADTALAAAGGDGEALTALSAETGVDEPVLYFVLRNAMQPFYAKTYRPEGDVSLPYPMRQTCPACGGRPFMARHALPDGHRFLCCAACGHEWAYPRMACPACGQTDHKRVEVMYLPGSEGHRVYLCSACGRYTKAADERLLGGSAYLPLEDLVTVHLDELARKRGYIPVNDKGPAPQGAEQERFH